MYCCHFQSSKSDYENENREEKRGKGRPKKRWLDTIKNNEGCRCVRRGCT